MNRTTKLLPALRDGRGLTVVLGQQLASGGEGAVYRVHGQPQVVAKLYHQPISATKTEKLKALTRQAPPAKLAGITAWPTTLLTDDRSRVVGFLMPLVAGRAGLTSLLASSLRRVSFPIADWRFLIAVARNVAAAVEALHAHGYIIGDLNDGGFLVSPTDATVMVVDIDSLQVRDGGTSLRCEVAKPLYTAPELHGATFTAIDRTENHDSFSLGVLVFQLLFLGRHPFAGRPLGNEDLNPEQWIREHRFAYGRGAARKHVAPPPNIILLQDLTAGISDLFEQAFSDASAPMRPKASAWRQALDELQRAIRPCPINRGHFFASSPRCPWCDIEQATGASLFPSVVMTAAGELTINIDQVIAEIMAFPASVTMPLPTRPTAVPVPSPLPSAVKEAEWWYQLRVAVIGVGSVFASLGILQAGGSGWIIAGIVLANVVHALIRGHLEAERTARQEALDQATIRLTAIEESWVRNQPAGLPDLLRQAKRDIEIFRNLNAEQAKEIAVVHAKDQERQLDEHLSRFTIAKASIPGIGDGRRATLIAYGIQTAADVRRERIQNIPRFGETLTASVMAWRKQCNSTFVLSRGKYSALISAEVTNRYQHRRRELAGTLQKYIPQLKRQQEQDQIKLLELERQLRFSHVAWAQARADRMMIKA